MAARPSAEHEHAEHDEGDQDREGDGKLHHERHAAGAGCRQDQAVFQRHEADDLGDGVAPGDHHQKAEQDHGEREGEILTRQGAHAGTHRDDQQNRERHEAKTQNHGRPAAQHLLDLAMDLEAANDPMQRCRDDEALDHDRDRRRHEQMRRVLEMRLPGDSQCQRDRLQREHVQGRGDAVLVEQKEAEDQHAARQQVSDIELQRAHQNPVLAPSAVASPRLGRKYLSEPLPA